MAIQRMRLELNFSEILRIVFNAHIDIKMSPDIV